MKQLNDFKMNVKNRYAWYQKRSFKQKRFVVGIGIFLIFCLLKVLFSASHNGKKKDKVGRNQVPTIKAEAVKKGDVPIYLMALGTITPAESVTIRTQINGQLLKILFTEGQKVKAGDLLAEIDSRIYEAQLQQYEGQFTKDKSLLDNAKLDLERYQNLLKKEAVSKQVLDTQASLVHQLEGTVKSDQGLIDTVKLNQTYCKIKAPISGLIGFRFVDQGNYVQVSDAKGLAVINTITPITVVFSLPEDNVQQVLKAMAQKAKIKVEAFDRGQNKLLATGTLESIDNQVDSSTGTVKFKAFFDNKDAQLFPNQFVNVRVLINTLSNETVIPTAAIQHSPTGNYVYKLGKENIVSVVPISLKTTHENNSAIDSKLIIDDLVITEGTDKLRDGMTVMQAGEKPSHFTEDKSSKSSNDAKVSHSSEHKKQT